MSSGILYFIVTQAFGSNDESDHLQSSCVQKISRLILDSIVKRLASDNRGNAVESTTLPPFLLWSGETVEPFALNSFCTSSLNFILKLKPLCEASHAIEEQCRWNSETVGCYLKILIEKLVKVLCPENVMAVLLEAFTLEKLNWKMVVFVVSTYAFSYSEGFSHFSSAVDSLLKQGFQEQNSHCLLISFLLVRQVISTGSTHFPLTYSAWFKKTFCDISSTYVKDVPALEFFMSFLTDLVPADQEQYLKVHIENPPCNAIHCRDVFTDYVALAKTKLTDLQKPPDTVIDKILKAFEATGKIPSTILEASMLHKHHYLNEFLPRILAPRMLPDVPDTKMKFIQVLKTAGKIPKELYEKYEDACGKIASGVMTIMSMKLEPCGAEKQLDDLVEKFKLQLDQTKREDVSSIKNHLSDFRAALQRFLKRICFTKRDGEGHVVMSKGARFSDMEVMKKIIRCYCYFQNVTFEQLNSSSCLWDLLSDLKSFTSLYKSMSSVLREKLTSVDENVTLKECRGLGVLLGRMVALNHGQFDVMHSNVSETVCSAIEIFEALPISTASEICNFHVFCYFYLKSILSDCSISYDSISPLPACVFQSMMKKFQFTFVRLDRMHRNSAPAEVDSIFVEVSRLYHSTVFQHWLSSTKLSLPEWLRYEFNVNIESDFYAEEERYHYISWCIHNLYCTTQEESKNNVKSLRYCCSYMFRFIFSKLEVCGPLQHLWKVLKELLESLPTTPVNSDLFAMPWLLEEFHYAINRVDKMSRSFPAYMKVVSERYMRLVCDLPPFLLIGDLPQQIYLQGENLELADIITEYIKDFCIERNFLKPAFACHIMKSLLSSLICEDKDELEKRKEIVNMFLTTCPLFLCSFVAYYKLMQKTCPELVIHHKGELPTVLEDIFLIIPFMSQHQHSHEVIDQLMTVKSVHKWLIGFAMTKRIAWIRCKEWYTHHNPSARAVIMASVMFHIAFKVTAHGDADLSSTLCENVAAAIRHREERYFYPKNYNQSVLRDILGPDVWFHFPAGCLKLLLSSFPEDEMQQMDERTMATWLSLLLSNYSECFIRDIGSSLPDYFCDGTKALEQSSGILNTKFLHEALLKIERLLLIVPETTIELIPQSVVDDCDPHLKSFLE